MRSLVHAGLAGLVLLVPALAQAPQLNSVVPAEQVVHGFITLTGSGFGPYQPGVSRVEFQPGPGPSVGGRSAAGALSGGLGTAVPADTPYVWRDDFIQVRVPVGQGTGTGQQPIGKGPLRVRVVAGTGTSNARNFKVAYEPAGTLAFVQRTQLAGHDDVSGFLGSTEDNKTRTKDGDVADINGDGWPDLFDITSNNILNGTHSIARFNLGGTGFASRQWEPLTAADTGSYLVSISPGGDYYVDEISYDSDFVDLDNDGYVDWVHAVGHAAGRVRIAMNNAGGIPGRFFEDTATWIGQQPDDPQADDLAHMDLNGDGWIDVGVSTRFAPRGWIYINQAGSTFAPPISILGSGSMHDIVFMDGDSDGYPDVLLVDEGSTCRFYLNDGNPMPTFTQSATFPMGSFGGESADFDGDGRPDIVLGKNSGGGNVWNPVNLPSPPSPPLYDIEAGDIDLDGDVDIVAAIITTTADLAVVIWLNNGDGTFTSLTAGGATGVLPGLGPYQRLSADLIDFDQDGDLDLYLTGGDGQNVFGGGFGRVPNQFFENLVR
jgi:VCBS repeat protein